MSATHNNNRVPVPEVHGLWPNKRMKRRGIIAHKAKTDSMALRLI
jgi:hypothetical protein